MNPTILVRHLSNSSLAGQTREFQQRTIRFGRRPENDVVFNPELDRTVSGMHCEIVLDDGQLYVVDPGSTNGTFVNGVRVDGRMAVTDRDQITLGERGPVVAVAIASESAVGPSTIMGSVHPAASIAAPVGLEAIPMTADMPPAFSAGGGGAKTATLPHRAPSRLSQGQKTSIGMNTLMSELDKATKRERKRVFVLAGPILLVLFAGIGAAWYFTRPGPVQVVIPPATHPATIPMRPAEWSEVLSPRKSSVYLVVLRRPGKEDRGVGTAWSAKKGFLGTNAHVAQLFLDKDSDATLIARSNTNPPHDLKIVDVKLHPGYTTFKDLVRSHRPVDPESGESPLMAMPFDVGTMKIDEADVARQAPPLELADAAAMSKVVETSELAYIGFPMDSSVESGVNVKSPSAHQFIGNLTRKTDIFLAATTDERATFLQYTLVVQGGASGSPVFNREGKVVGLVSGNDHFISPALGPGARIAISGKSFGPRADALQDLFDNTADAKTAPYATEWRTHFRGVFDKAMKAEKYGSYQFQPAFEAFEVLGLIRKSSDAGRDKPLFKPQNASKVKSWTIELSAAGEGSGTETTTPPLADAGTYAIVAWTDNPDLLPQVAIPEIDTAYAQLPPKAFKTFREKLGDKSPFVSSWALQRDAGQTITFKVSGLANGPTSKAKMTVVLMKATE